MPKEPVFAVEVEHPLSGWVRLKSRYRSKKSARGWYPFIKAAWHGLPLRTVSVREEVQQEAPK